MKIVTQKEFDEIVSEHQKYLLREEENWQEKRADFSDKIISGITVKGIELINGIFNRTVIENCTFIDTDLSCCFFHKATIKNSIFKTSDDYEKKCNISLSQFQCSKLDNVEFTNVNINMANFNWSELNSVIIRNSNIIYCLFKEAILKNTTIQACELDETNFLGSKLKCVDFRFSNLRKAYFKEEKP